MAAERVLGLSRHSLFEISLQDQDSVCFCSYFGRLGWQFLQCKLQFLDYYYSCLVLVREDLIAVLGKGKGFETGCKC